MRSMLFALSVGAWVFSEAACAQLGPYGPSSTTPVAAAPGPATVGPPAAYFEGPWPKGLLNTEDVKRLVGPIALYPDPLLAQVLPASTNPLDVVKAARLVRAGADEASIAATDLDASAQALAHFPEVLAMMDEHLDWTERLGRAFIDQPDDVITSVQRLREVARWYGNLVTTPEREVVIGPDTIRILPATEYVYVPIYEPTVVYTNACPPTYRYVSFRSCYRIGPWSDLDCDWRRRAVCWRDGWSWRDYYDRRRTWSDAHPAVDYFHNDCDRPVHDWRYGDGHRDRHDDHRGDGHDRHDHDGGDRADQPERRTPRAAEPNPPVITAPSPSPPQETHSPRRTPRQAARVDQPDASRQRSLLPGARLDEPRTEEVARAPRRQYTPTPRAAVQPAAKPADGSAPVVSADSDTPPKTINPRAAKRPPARVERPTNREDAVPPPARNSADLPPKKATPRAAPKAEAPVVRSAPTPPPPTPAAPKPPPPASKPDKPAPKTMAKADKPAAKAAGSASKSGPTEQPDQQDSAKPERRNKNKKG